VESETRRYFYIGYTRIWYTKKNCIWIYISRMNCHEFEQKIMNYIVFSFMHCIINRNKNFKNRTYNEILLVCAKTFRNKHKIISIPQFFFLRFLLPQFRLLYAVLAARFLTIFLSAHNNNNRINVYREEKSKRLIKTSIGGNSSFSFYNI